MTVGFKLTRPLAAATTPTDGTALVLAIGWATKGRLWEWIPARYDKLEDAERRILQRSLRVPFEMTKVASLGTVVVPCTDANKRASGNVKDLVLIHGFAGGNAMWAMNLEHLAKHFNVYAVEWIGVGRSDRPDFPYNDYDSADEFIVGSFEQWRREMDLDRFHLCAHSMGAIFASSYALRFPDNVSHLVLASPAGVGRPPVPPSPEEQRQLEQQPQASRVRSLLRRLVFAAWDYNVTPMSVARAAGPYGPELVQNTLLRRISFMPETSAMRQGLIDVAVLGEYLYHNWALKASGEKAMSTHLAPIAFARRPLIDMLLPGRVRMPITFVYGGESDWMDYRQGQKVVERLREGGHLAALHLVPSSGHQVFLDNPAEFNRIVVDALVQE